MNRPVLQSDAVLLSHWDLDGAGCSVIADHIWNIKDRKHQGYGKIRKSLEYLVNNHSADVQTIVIADLKILPEDLEYAISNFDNVVYYDHHESSAEFVSWTEKFSNFECHFDLTRCSTALMWIDGVKTKGVRITSRLDAFMQTVNAYDMWNQKSKRWKHGLLLNDLFWEISMDAFRERFADGLTHFTIEELLFADQQEAKRKKAVDDAIIETTDDGSTIVMLSDSIAIGAAAELLDGDIFYIIPVGERASTNISVRLKGEAQNLNVNEGCSLLAEKFPGVIQSGGGHKFAGGITFVPNTTINNMVDFLLEHAPAIRADMGSTV